MTEKKTLLTVSASPHLHSPVSTTTIMSDVLIALTPGADLGLLCVRPSLSLYHTRMRRLLRGL